MANEIRIKRSIATNSPSSLVQGELAYSESASPNGIGELFIGISGSSLEKIGGASAVYDEDFTTNGFLKRTSAGVYAVSSTINLTSEVAGDLAFANLAQVAATSFLGNSTGSLADAASISATTATSMLNVFTSALKGLAPSSGGGTTNFLRADGTWTTPAGSGDVVGPASATDNAVARYDTTTGKLLQNSAVTIADTTGNMAGVGTLNTHTIPGGTGTFELEGHTHDANTLTGTTLAAGVITSSLTTVGTITSGTWQGTTVAVNQGGTGVTAASTGTGGVVLSISPTFTGTLAAAIITATGGIDKLTSLTGVVSVDTSDASIGKVLTATSASVATWQSPAALGVIIQEEGTEVHPTATTIDFVGPGVTATSTGGSPTGNDVTVTIDGAAGSDTEFQYNNGGAFGGIAELVYNDTSKQLTYSQVAANTLGFGIGDVLRKGMQISTTGTTTELTGTTEYLLSLAGRAPLNGQLMLLDATGGAGHGLLCGGGLTGHAIYAHNATATDIATVRIENTDAAPTGTTLELRQGNNNGDSDFIRCLDNGLNLNFSIADSGVVIAVGGIDKLTTSTGNTPISVNTSTPSATQVLTATSATVATWQTPTVGTVTSVTAGNGMTQSGTSTINPTLDVASHAGSAGTIGTINIAADSIGVNLGATSTTAAAGNHTHATFDRATSVLSGANVFSNIVVTDGITTAIATRALTAGDVGAEATDATIVRTTDTGSATWNWILDEDNLATDSATHVPTQQSVKAYVDAVAASEMTYKGGFDPTAAAGAGVPNLNTVTSAIGDMYTVTAAGTYNFTTGTDPVLEVGDVMIAEVAGTLSDAGQWTIVNQNLSNVVNTARTITAGVGLIGGGDLTADRTIDLDINTLTTDAGSVGSEDYLPFYHTSTGSPSFTGMKKILINDILDGGTF